MIFLVDRGDFCHKAMIGNDKKVQSNWWTEMLE